VLLLVVAGPALAGDGPVSGEGGPSRQAFAVEPFRNVQRLGALQHLVYGLPAVVAERFAQAAPLRFAGRPELFSRRPPTGATWLVGGAFERRADWSVAITVEIRRAAAPDEVVARASRVGSKDALPAAAIDAAEAAFASLPGVSFAPEQAARRHERFTADPYAFVLYARGVGAFHGGGGGPARARLAEQYLRHALRVEPMVPEVQRFLAEALLAEDQPAGAQRAPARGLLAAALDRRADYLLALRALAVVDRTDGAAAALERYARLVELDPEDVGARRTYGEMLVEAGRLADARKQLEVVLAAAPDDASARRLLVGVLSSRKEGSELATELEAAVKGEPNDLDLRMELGAAYLAMGRARDAAAVYDEVLRRRPRHTGALKLAGDLARQRGELKTAIADYARLRALAPQDPRPTFLLAATYAQAGDLDRAERWFEEAGQMPGMLGDAWSNLGAIALRRGDARQALWYLSRAVKRRPERVAVRYNHALALHQLGRDAEAQDELRAAAELDPGDAGVRFFGGVVALSLGKLEEATVDFKAAVELDPSSDDARENLAQLEGRESESAMP
jgi:Flp pilus assembly protein TadD